MSAASQVALALARGPRPQYAVAQYSGLREVMLLNMDIVMDIQIKIQTRSNYDMHLYINMHIDSWCVLVS